MTNHLRLIAQLRKSFKEDSVCLFYSGDFDDFFTDKMINLIGFENEKRMRGNLAFVIAESFQNVVRHRNPFIRKGTENVFGIRGRKDFVNVFSSNLVSDITKKELIERLESINSMTADELRDAFMDILERGELSEKGGAGMGLIEMVRRSGNKLQYEFQEVEQGIYAFNMQIDFHRHRGVEAYSDKLVIEENSILNDLIIDNGIQFIYKGQFSEIVLGPILPIVESCTKSESVDQSVLMKVANGLVQNIETYGMPDSKGRRKGLFALKKIEEGFYMCSGNYTTEDTDHLKSIVDKMNVATQEELDVLYWKVSSEKAKSQESDERIGLLDIRRSSGQPIDLKLSEDSRGVYAMIGVRITSESLTPE